MSSCHNCGMAPEPEQKLTRERMSEFDQLQKFAKQYRLKTRRDECNEVIIPGRQGQIYQWANDGSVFGVMFMTAKPREEWNNPPTEAEMWGKWQPRKWAAFKRSAIAIGMSVLQNGESEGCLGFDPKNKAQVKMAMKIAGVRPKRRVPPEMVARLGKHVLKRFQRPEEGHFSVQNAAVGVRQGIFPIERKSANLRTRTTVVARAGVTQ